MKRTAATSAENVVKAMVNVAKGDPEPPKHVRLRPGDEPFWTGVIRARARDEWGETDLVIAAQLARCQHDIETQSAMLDDEGSVIENARGTPVCNPRVAVLEGLARREMALMRSLRMGGRIAGDIRDQAGPRKAERSARKVAEELEDDELLA